jgi:hypothetical protein
MYNCPNKEYLMKKILSTTLVAVAFAMVSTVDAKVMARKASATTTVPQERREATQELVQNQTQENLNQTVNMLASEPVGVAITAERAKQDEIKLQKDLVSTLGKKGWIFDGRTTEEKQAHQEASDKLARLEQELKDIQAKNKDLKAEVGVNYYNAVLGSFIAALAIGGMSIIDDILYKGAGKAAIKPYYEAGKAKFAAAVSTAKTKASQMSDAAYKRGQSMYDKLPSMRATKPTTTVTTPQYNLPEYQ